MADVVKIFSVNMKKIRLEKKMTQEELSFKSGLHKNYISDAERGRRNISIRAVEKIARGLECSVEDFFKEI